MFNLLYSSHEAGNEDLQHCVTALYEDSQRRGLFADPGYYLIPDNAPVPLPNGA